MEEIIQNITQVLSSCGPDFQILQPEKLEDIPSGEYMVYLLYFNRNAIIIGQGRRNRARVILDNLNVRTKGHIKALFVRLYCMYGGDGAFLRFIIPCNNQVEAKKMERKLQAKFGGNNRLIPEEIRNGLFDGLEPESHIRMLLEIAINSDFDGLNDVVKWKTKGIISNEIWADISNRLGLN